MSSRRSGVTALFTIWVVLVLPAKTQNHLKLVSFQNQSKPISLFLPGANSTLNDKIIKAETLFSNFVAEHNLTFQVLAENPMLGTPSQNYS
jgi:hypothetical protein